MPLCQFNYKQLGMCLGIVWFARGSFGNNLGVIRQPWERLGHHLERSESLWEAFATH